MLLALRDVLADVPWDQIFPLLFVFVIVPFLTVGVYNRARITFWLATTTMVFESLGFNPWGWINGVGSNGGGEGPKKSSATTVAGGKKTTMRRADNKTDGEGLLGGSADGRYYPGLVNISGTYCFMNSTLQAMASLTYLHPHINVVHARAERLDVPTPVVDAVRDLLNELNTPTSRPRSIRPHALINALSSPPTGSSSINSRSALFSSREHQDAQELFQLLSEAIKNEAKAVDEEASRDRGLGSALSSSTSNSNSRETSPGSSSTGSGGSSYLVGRGGVFDGLTANRRSCVECGYTEAVMHFAFDNWQLTVPRMASCRLEDCLADYTRLELLNDCICRKCSMLATHRRLLAETERAAEILSNTEEGAVSASKKKRAREARRLEAKVKAALQEARIEEDIKGVKVEKVFSRCSTKQAMIARPPPVLALHLNRSIHYGGHSGVKNTCRVSFPEILDLTPYTTSGQLSTSPSAPISSPPPPPSSGSPRRPSTPTQADPHPQRLDSNNTSPRTLYRLAAVVCHYGTHSFGHYVAYRRKPRPPHAGRHRYDPPTLRCPLDCDCDKCLVSGPIRDDGDDDETQARAGLQQDDEEKKKIEMPAYATSRWLRISDETVEEVGIERVLEEYAGTFMLYYEKVVQADFELRRQNQHGPAAEEELQKWLASASASSASAVYSSSSATPMAAWSSASPRSSEETIRPAKELRDHPEQPPPTSSSSSQPEEQQEEPAESGSSVASLLERNSSRRTGRRSPRTSLEARIVQSVYAGFRSRTPTPSVHTRDLSPAVSDEDDLSLDENAARQAAGEPRETPESTSLSEPYEEEEEEEAAAAAAMSQSQPSLKIQHRSKRSRHRSRSHSTHAVSIPVRTVGLRA